MKIKQRGSTTIILLVFIVLILSGVIIYLSLKDKNKIEEKDIKDEVGQIQVIDNSTSTVSKATTSSHKIVSKTTTEKAMGMIKSVYTKNNKNYIDIDYVVLESCMDITPDDCPNGISLKNDNPLIRTFEVSPNAIVNVNASIIDSTGKTQNLNNIGYEGLIKIFKNKEIDHKKINPWDITIKDGLIVEITEHFLP